jgi:hypothetical protein
MFQTLDKVMTLGDRLAGTLNLMENAPASMTATLAKGIIDNGAQVHSAVHRRLVGSITEEVRSFAAMADAMDHLPDNIDGKSPIEVTADPNMATEMHRAATAQAYHDMLQMPMVFNPHEVGLRYAQTMRFPNPDKLIAPPPPKPEATPAEKLEGMLSIEKEKTNRIKANAQSAFQLASAVNQLAQAATVPGNIDLMRLQLAQLEKTMEQITNDTGGVGNGSAGMAGQPPDAAPANAPAAPPQPDIAGAAIGPASGPDPTGAGGGVQPAAPPMGLAAG